MNSPVHSPYIRPPWKAQYDPGMFWCSLSLSLSHKKQTNKNIHACQLRCGPHRYCVPLGTLRASIRGYIQAGCLSEGESRRERGEAGCKLTTVLTQEPRNFVREISGLYINGKELTIVRVDWEMDCKDSCSLLLAVLLILPYGCGSSWKASPGCQARSPPVGLARKPCSLLNAP